MPSVAAGGVRIAHPRRLDRGGGQGVPLPERPRGAESAAGTMRSGARGLVGSGGGRCPRPRQGEQDKWTRKSCWKGVGVLRSNGGWMEPGGAGSARKDAEVAGGGGGAAGTVAMKGHG